MLESADEWGKGIRGFDLEIAQETFMDTVGSLCFDYFQNHEEEAKIFTLDYESSISTIFEFINKEYVSHMYYKLQNISPEISGWVFACKIKTNIEAFNFLFGHVVGKLEDPGIQTYLEERKESADIAWSEIPQNAPKSHWWWYA